MKLLNPLAGTAAVRIIPDEVMPTGGLLQRDLIEFVGDLYGFHMKPPSTPGTPSAPILPFSSGFFMQEDKKIIIQQLVIFPDGEAVVAFDTDVADIILDDFLERLAQRFEYGFHAAKQERLYTSALALEFDDRFTERAAVFSIIQRVAGEVSPLKGKQYRLKQLSFSADASPETGQVTFVSQFASSDFSLERRVATPLDRNIFFSSAPLRTQDHIAYLKRIEEEVIAA
jgi:hypothetical protein